MADPDSGRAEHLRDAGETISELREERRQALPRSERLVERIMGHVGTPLFVLSVAAFIVAWILVDLALRGAHRAFDTPTFALLNDISQFSSLVVVLVILSAQNSQRKVEQERGRLTLQMVLVLDKKVTRLLRALGAAPGTALQRQTDLHEAAETLRKAEREKDER